jgi:hypothetical protein
MPKSNQNRFVADGQRRITSTGDYQHKAQQIRTVVQAKYEEEIARAGRLKGWLLRFRMRREMARELEKLAPDRALYLAHSK